MKSPIRYAKANKVPAALLLFGLVVALGAAKSGALPDARRTAGLLVAAVLIVGATAVLPDLVVAFLAALLIVFAIAEEQIIADAARRLMALLNGATAATRLPSRHLREAA
jgi:predicted MFS family arabinose efflux permease